MSTTAKTTIQDKNFAFKNMAGRWQIYVNGRVVLADFGCYAAALFGIATQLRRDRRASADELKPT